MKQLINFWLISAIIPCGLVQLSPTIAQVVPDATLPVNSQVTPAGNTNVITGGTQVGNNLFHSFEQFSITTGSQAYFNNALNIQNVISRVTGRSISNIDGLIRANGIANLFFLNPNGVVFGPNAKLDIGGSFVASTASSIKFADKTEFSVTNPQSPPLLTVTTPIGLQFGRSAGGIEVRESMLKIQNGQTLAFIGGNVSIEGGVPGYLEASGGQIELGGLADAGMVQIEGQQSQETFKLTELRFPNSVERADVLLTNKSLIYVAGSGGGSIAINAHNLNITDSDLVAGVGKDLGSIGTQAGDITLNATGTILTNNSLIANHVALGAIGNAGGINVQAGSLFLNDSRLKTDTYGQGNGGNINIDVRDTATITNILSIIPDGSVNAYISSDVLPGAIGNGGDINIKAESLSLNDSWLSTDTYGQGNGGNVNIEVRDIATITNTISITPDGGLNSYGQISSDVLPGAIGNGGDINIIAGYIESQAALLRTTTSGQGNAGSIFLQANDSISLADTTLVLSTVEPRGIGNGGDINIGAGSLSLTGGTQLQTIVRGADRSNPLVPAGRGNSGDFNIDVRDTITLVGGGQPFTGIFTGVDFRGAVGNVGDINVNTGSLYIMNGAVVGGSSNEPGDSGDITIRAIDKVYLANSSDFDPNTYRGSSRLTSQASVNGAEGADIDIQARSLSLLNGAYVDVSTVGERNAGNITVMADTLEATNGGQIITYATKNSSGTAGNINLNISDSITLTGSDPFYEQRLALFPPDRDSSAPARFPQGSPTSGLYAQSEGIGSAGNVTVNTRDLLVKKGARITVSSPRDQAGNLTVTANFLSLDQGSLTAETGKSDAQGGANISLNNLDLLRLANESSISASALEAANGGNINIDAKLIVASPPSGAQGSDIVANAVKGNGGRVDIRTQGLFGIEYQPFATPSNDITASSEFGIDGVVDINIPNIDVNRGFVNLPAIQFDTQVVQACQPGGRQQQSEFVVTGRGGLPPNPSDVLSSDAVWTDLSSSTEVIQEARHSLKKATQVTESNIEQIVEATGWVVNDKGEVVLTASTLTELPSSSDRSATKCNVS